MIPNTMETTYALYGASRRNCEGQAGKVNRSGRTTENRNRELRGITLREALVITHLQL
jgi:hypothetical protein